MIENGKSIFGDIERLLTKLLLMLRSRQSETTNASETAQNGGWVFTLVGKDCNNGDTGPAELMYEDRLIAAIKRLLEQDEETTHVEVHEGTVG